MIDVNMIGADRLQAGIHVLQDIRLGSRVGFPEDMYGVALFLASPASDYVTGQEIIVDGGQGLGVADYTNGRRCGYTARGRVPCTLLDFCRSGLPAAPTLHAEEFEQAQCGGNLRNNAG